MMKEVYVVNCCRTAIGSYGGSLKDTPAVELGALVIKEALKRANVAPEHVDEVMFGCILNLRPLARTPPSRPLCEARARLSRPPRLTPWVWCALRHAVRHRGRPRQPPPRRRPTIVVAGGMEKHVRRSLCPAPRSAGAPAWVTRRSSDTHDPRRSVGTPFKQLSHGAPPPRTSARACGASPARSWTACRARLPAEGPEARHHGPAGVEDGDRPPHGQEEEGDGGVPRWTSSPASGTNHRDRRQAARALSPVGPEGVVDSNRAHLFQPTEVHEADAHKSTSSASPPPTPPDNQRRRLPPSIRPLARPLEEYGLEAHGQAGLLGPGRRVDPKSMGVGPVPASRQAMAQADLKTRGYGPDSKANEALCRPVPLLGPASLHFDNAARSPVNGWCHRSGVTRRRCRRPHHRHPAARNGRGEA